MAAAPAGVKKAAAPAKPVNPLYEKRPKTFGATPKASQKLALSPPAADFCRTAKALDSLMIRLHIFLRFSRSLEVLTTLRDLERGLGF